MFTALHTYTGRYFFKGGENVSSSFCKPAFLKSDEERKKVILETGINEFATLGLEEANINVIAKKAGVSVGLLYKYFATKEDFFLTCVEEAVKTLEEIVSEVVTSNDKILVRAEKLIRTIQKTSGADSKYVKLYNEITKISNEKELSKDVSESAKLLANRVEGVSAKAYSDFIAKAQKDGDIRNDCDPKMFAFFFDSVLMTLQFSYTCDYYRERMKIFCGEDIFENDEKVVDELLKFFESAFTFSRSDLK